MPIYTKKGDKGKTSLLGSKKQIAKSSIIISTIGNIDEANSFLGIIETETNSKILKTQIRRIQNNLFTINSIIAGSKLVFKKAETQVLEQEIDQMSVKLPKLTNFLLPGGDKVAAELMYARTIVRRAERQYVSLPQKKKNKEIMKYINRLSDYLFVLFRYEMYKALKKEIIWKG